MSMRDYIGDGDVKVLWGEDIKPVTNQAADIFDRLIPEWGKSFLQKNRKYKAVTNDLGPRGVFPDVNRKTGILKDRIWDGNSVVGESTREVIMDLIGHLFLMLHMIDTESEQDVEWDVSMIGRTMTPIGDIDAEGWDVKVQQYPHKSDCVICEAHGVGQTFHAYRSPEPELMHDEQTLQKVYQPLIDAGLSPRDAESAINDMQNNGIYFREARKS